MTNGDGEGEEINWLECIPWDGREASLPLGGDLSGGLFPIDMVYRWEVADAESEDGYKVVKPSELKDEDKDKVIGGLINENLYKKELATYGPKFVQIAQSTGAGKLTREEWKAKYGTDGLVLWAIRELRYPIKPVKIGGAGGITTTAPQAKQIGDKKKEFKKLGRY